MTTEAANKITSVISATIAEADQLAESSRSSAQVGMEQSKKSSELMNEILKTSDTLSKGASDVHKSSQEQSIGVKLINDSIRELKEVSEKTSTATKEATDSAKDLADNAKNLDGFVTDLTKLLSGDKDKEAPDHKVAS